MIINDKEDSGFIISNTETWEDKLEEIQVDSIPQNIKLTNNENKDDDDDDFDFDDI